MQVTITSRLAALITGLFWVAVPAGILFIWREPAGVLYWVRCVLFALGVFFGLLSLKIGLFDSEEQINRLGSDEP